MAALSSEEMADATDAIRIKTFREQDQPRVAVALRAGLPRTLQMAAVLSHLTTDGSVDTATSTISLNVCSIDIMYLTSMYRICAETMRVSGLLRKHICLIACCWSIISELHSNRAGRRTAQWRRPL